MYPTTSPAKPQDKNTPTPSALSLRPFRDMGGGTPIRTQTSCTTFGFVPPRTFDTKDSPELWGNQTNCDTVCKWINDKLERRDTYPYILLIGPVGVGKSEFLKMCFRRTNCNVIEYDDELRGTAYDMLKDSINMSNIECIFSDSKRRMGTIIDNYHTTLIAAHRKEFITYLRTTKTCPVIFTSDTVANTTDLQRGKGLVLHFELPTISQMTQLGRKLSPERSVEELTKIAERCHPDIRSFKNLLNSTITEFKDLNMEIYDNLTYFFNNDFKNNMRQTSMFTSHIVQENYLSMAPKNINLNDLWEMSEYCSMGDIVKQSSFENQSWDYMIDISNGLGTLGPIHVLRKHNAKVVAKVPNRKIVSMPNYISETRLSLLDMYYIYDKILGRVDIVEDNIEGFFEFTKDIEFETSLRILHQVYSFKNIPYKDTKRITSKLKKYYETNFSDQ